MTAIDVGRQADDGGQEEWRASMMALFLPGLVIAVGYGMLWFYLLMDGRGEGALSRICLAVLIIGVPLLSAHAGLRFFTTRLKLRATRMEAHPGFPARDPTVIDYQQIQALSLRRGLSGVLTGSGSLLIHYGGDRRGSRRLVVSGLREPERALAAIEARRPAAISGRRGKKSST